MRKPAQPEYAFARKPGTGANKNKDTITVTHTRTGDEIDLRVPSGQSPTLDKVDLAFQANRAGRYRDTLESDPTVYGTKAYTSSHRPPPAPTYNGKALTQEQSDWINPKPSNKPLPNAAQQQQAQNTAQVAQMQRSVARRIPQVAPAVHKKPGRLQQVATGIAELPGGMAEGMLSGINALPDIGFDLASGDTRQQGLENLSDIATGLVPFGSVIKQATVARAKMHASTDPKLNSEYAAQIGLEGAKESDPGAIKDAWIQKLDADPVGTIAQDIAPIVLGGLHTKVGSKAQYGRGVVGPDIARTGRLAPIDANPGRSIGSIAEAELFNRTGGRIGAHAAGVSDELFSDLKPGLHARAIPKAIYRGARVKDTAPIIAGLESQGQPTQGGAPLYEPSGNQWRKPTDALEQSLYSEEARQASAREEAGAKRARQQAALRARAVSNSYALPDPIMGGDPFAEAPASPLAGPQEGPQPAGLLDTAPPVFSPHRRTAITPPEPSYAVDAPVRKRVATARRKPVYATQLKQRWQTNKTEPIEGSKGNAVPESAAGESMLGKEGAQPPINVGLRQMGEGDAGGDQVTPAGTAPVTEPEPKPTVTEPQPVAVPGNEQEAGPVGQELLSPPLATGTPLHARANSQPATQSTAGNTGTTYTVRGESVPYEWKVSRADDIITSHDDALNERPEYPQALQPRNRRKSVSSQAQVHDIAHKMIPDWLGESHLANFGAPITKEGIVEAGNGRTLAIKRMFQQRRTSPLLEKNASAYDAYVRKFAADHGIAVPEGDGPLILHRERTNDLNMAERRRLARDMNRDPQMKHDEGELADRDTELLTTTGALDKLEFEAGGGFGSTKNKPFRNAFFMGKDATGKQAFPISEMNDFFNQKSGGLTKAGDVRMRNAMTSYAYEDPDFVSSLSAEGGEGAGALSTAITRTSPQFAKAKHETIQGRVADLDITSDIRRATENVRAIREKHTGEQAKQAAEALAAQEDIFDPQSTEAKALTQIFLDSKAPIKETFYSGRNGAARIQSFLENYAEGWLSERPGEEGRPARTKLELMRDADAKTRAEYNIEPPKPGDLFDQPETTAPVEKAPETTPEPEKEHNYIQGDVVKYADPIFPKIHHWNVEYVHGDRLGLRSYKDGLMSSGFLGSVKKTVNKSDVQILYKFKPPPPTVYPAVSGFGRGKAGAIPATPEGVEIKAPLPETKNAQVSNVPSETPEAPLTRATGQETASGKPRPATEVLSELKEKSAKSKREAIKARIDEAEKTATESLHARAKNLGEQLNSPDPTVFLGALKDMAVIGASRIAKGALTFADFVDGMHKEFGARYEGEVAPYIDHLWLAAKTHYADVIKPGLEAAGETPPAVPVDITDAMPHYRSEFYRPEADLADGLYDGIVDLARRGRLTEARGGVAKKPVEVTRQQAKILLDTLGAKRMVELQKLGVSPEVITSFLEQQRDQWQRRFMDASEAYAAADTPANQTELIHTEAIMNVMNAQSAGNRTAIARAMQSLQHFDKLARSTTDSAIALNNLFPDGAPPLSPDATAHATAAPAGTVKGGMTLASIAKRAPKDAASTALEGILNPETIRGKGEEAGSSPEGAPAPAPESVPGVTRAGVPIEAGSVEVGPSTTSALPVAKAKPFKRPKVSSAVGETYEFEGVPGLPEPKMAPKRKPRNIAEVIQQDEKLQNSLKSSLAKMKSGLKKTGGKLFSIPELDPELLEGIKEFATTVFKAGARSFAEFVNVAKPVLLSDEDFAKLPSDHIDHVLEQGWVAAGKKVERAGTIDLGEPVTTPAKTGKFITRPEVPPAHLATAEEFPGMTGKAAASPKSLHARATPLIDARETLTEPKPGMTKTLPEPKLRASTETPLLKTSEMESPTGKAPEPMTGRAEANPKTTRSRAGIFPEIKPKEEMTGRAKEKPESPATNQTRLFRPLGEDNTGVAQPMTGKAAAAPKSMPAPQYQLPGVERDMTGRAAAEPITKQAAQSAIEAGDTGAAAKPLFLSDRSEAVRQRLAREYKPAKNLKRDPKTVPMLTEVGGHIYQSGYKKFAEWSVEMNNALGTKIDAADLTAAWKGMYEAANKRVKFERDYRQQAIKRAGKVLSPENAKKAADEIRNIPKDDPAKLDKFRDIIEKYRKPTVFDYVREGQGILRSIWTSYDLSAPGRQGILLASRKAWWQSWGPMMKVWYHDMAHLAAKIAGKENTPQAQAFRRASDEVMAHIETQPYYDLAQKSKLSLTEVGGDTVDFTKREEIYQSNVLQRLAEKPLYKDLPKGPGIILDNPATRLIASGVENSERTYATFMNRLRYEAFAQEAKFWSDKGFTPEVYPEVYEQIADHINNLSGRGKLPSLLEKGNVPSIAAEIIFSPRFQASRIRTLAAPYTFARSNFIVRRQIARDVAGMFALMTPIYAMAKALGAEVTWDWRSSNFGKIKVGDTRYDPLGGLGQYIHLIGQEVTGQRVNDRGQVTELEGPNKPFGGAGRLDVLANFFRTKLAPYLGEGATAVAGKDVVGNIKYRGTKAQIAGDIGSNALPLPIKDAIQTKQQYNAKEVLKQAPALVGIGTQTYNPSRPRERR